MRKVFVSYWVESIKSVRNIVIDVDIDNFNPDTISDMEEIVEIKHKNTTNDDSQCWIINWKVL